MAHQTGWIIRSALLAPQLKRPRKRNQRITHIPVQHISRLALVRIATLQYTASSEFCGQGKYLQNTGNLFKGIDVSLACVTLLLLTP